jgi:hypothetical protein
MSARKATAEFHLSDSLLERCRERAPMYDRENRFCQEDFDELKAAGYLRLAIPAELGGFGMRNGRALLETQDWKQAGVVVGPNSEGRGTCELLPARPLGKSAQISDVSCGDHEDRRQSAIQEQIARCVTALKSYKSALRDQFGYKPSDIQKTIGAVE